MSWLRHDGNYPTGAGDLDRNLADRLFNASSKRAADSEAVKDGLKDAEDAVDWLVSRSEHGWVG